jgi:hypothetical protein
MSPFWDGAARILSARMRVLLGLRSGFVPSPQAPWAARGASRPRGALTQLTALTQAHTRARARDIGPAPFGTRARGPPLPPIRAARTPGPGPPPHLSLHCARPPARACGDPRVQSAVVNSQVRLLPLPVGSWRLLPGRRRHDGGVGRPGRCGGGDSTRVPLHSCITERLEINPSCIGPLCAIARFGIRDHSSACRWPQRVLQTRFSSLTRPHQVRTAPIGEDSSAPPGSSQPREKGGLGTRQSRIAGEDTVAPQACPGARSSGRTSERARRAPLPRRRRAAAPAGRPRRDGGRRAPRRRLPGARRRAVRRAVGQGRRRGRARAGRRPGRRPERRRGRRAAPPVRIQRASEGAGCGRGSRAVFSSTSLACGAGPGAARAQGRSIGHGGRSGAPTCPRADLFCSADPAPQASLCGSWCLSNSTTCWSRWGARQAVFVCV